MPAAIPYRTFWVLISAVVELLGATLIVTNRYPRLGAWLIVLFLVPVTLYMHRFWGVADPQAAKNQMINFMKNLSLLGAAFYFAAVGSGPASLKD